jgi:hypothetical protein
MRERVQFFSLLFEKKANKPHAEKMISSSSSSSSSSFVPITSNHAVNTTTKNKNKSESFKNKSESAKIVRERFPNHAHKVFFGMCGFDINLMIDEDFQANKNSFVTRFNKKYSDPTPDFNKTLKQTEKAYMKNEYEFYVCSKQFARFRFLVNDVGRNCKMGKLSLSQFWVTIQVLNVSTFEELIKHLQFFLNSFMKEKNATTTLNVITTMAPGEKEKKYPSMVLFRTSRFDDYYEDFEEENNEIAEDIGGDYDDHSSEYRNKPEDYDHVKFNFSIDHTKVYDITTGDCQCYLCSGNWIRDLVRGLITSIRGISHFKTRPLEELDFFSAEKEKRIEEFNKKIKKAIRDWKYFL